MDGEMDSIVETVVVELSQLRADAIAASSLEKQRLSMAMGEPHLRRDLSVCPEQRKGEGREGAERRPEAGESRRSVQALAWIAYIERLKT
jgi:hypothetical protein